MSFNYICVMKVTNNGEIFSSDSELNRQQKQEIYSLLPFARNRPAASEIKFQKLEHLTGNWRQ